MNTLRTMFLAIVLLSTQALADGVEHPRQARQTYLNFGWQGYSTSTWYRGSTAVDVDHIRDNTFTMIGEYGYSSSVTGVMRLAGYRYLSVRETPDGPSRSVQAPGDAELGLRWAFAGGEQHSVSLAVTASFPLGETSDALGLWTGDGEYNQIFGLQYLYTPQAFPIAVAVGAGFNNRNGGYSDEWHYSAALELGPIGPFTLAMLVNGIEPLKNGDNAWRGGNFGFGTNMPRFIAYGPHVRLELLDGFGVTAGARQYTNMENVASGWHLNGGVFFLLDGMRQQD